MPSLSFDLAALAAAELQPAFDLVAPGADPAVSASDFADLQANGALALARVLGRPPREIAAEIVAAMPPGDVFSEPTVTGPGFINLTFQDRYLASLVEAFAAHPHAGVPLAAVPERIVIDYSAPNVAKEMHVGHLRSTVIGDALVRLLEFEGHDVVRENHIGDWGTPFGMLIEHLSDLGGTSAVGTLSAGALTDFYRDARAVRRRSGLPGAQPRTRRQVAGGRSRHAGALAHPDRPVRGRVPGDLRRARRAAHEG